MNAAIIVGGGIGARMKNSLPKQFLEVNHRPLIFYSIEQFYAFDKGLQLIIVLPETYHDYWKELCEKHSFKIPHQVAAGGETRYHSVKNGLKLINKASVIAVHDAVRPFITREFLQTAYHTASEKGSAIPIVGINDTVRKINNEGTNVLNRNELFLVQTPQIFKSEWLEKAYTLPYNEAITDDAMLVEKAGYTLTFIEGLKQNIKITVPEDLIFAEKKIVNG
jgi:2-C-methyl-D-erythritol 4-phosphate cytidylyltransferase